jgi:hypothetical protein
MRTTLLAWGLFMLVLETVGRLFLWISLGLVYEGLLETWIHPTEMRSITTVAVVLFTVFLWRTRTTVPFEERAKAAIVLLAFLVAVSVTLFGTEAGAGYTLLGQPTALLARFLTLSSLWMIVFVFWPTPYGSIYLKTLLIATAAYGSIGFFQLHEPFEMAFRQPMFLRMPFYLQPAPFASLLAAPAALAAGVAVSIKAWRRRKKQRTGLIGERWLEFSFIALTIAMALRMI